MPHPERACEAVLGSADGRVMFESVVSALALARRSPAEAAGQAYSGARDNPSDMSPIDSAVLERHGLKPDEVRPHRARSEREPTLTELGIFSVMWSEHCSYKSSRIHLQEAADHRPARAAGAGRERRRRRHRRRPRRGLQDRVAQPSVVHRALSGRGHRRRRHHPRHLHHGRAADRADELAALRSARRSRRRPHPPHRRRRRRRHRRLRQLHRHSDGRRRDRLRRARTPAIRWSTSSASASRRRTRSSRARPPASATRSTTSARRPAATASTARRWRRRSSTRSRPRSGRRSRSAIRSWRSSCSRPAWS